MANNKDIEIKVKVDTSDVEKSMKDMEKTAKNTSDKVAKNADKMEKAYEEVGNQLKDITKQTQNAFANMNINGFTNAMNKVKQNVTKTMKDVQQTISKALNTTANIKVKATTTTDASNQQQAQNNANVTTGLLAGGAMGSAIQQNLSRTKESAYDLIKAMGVMDSSYKETLKDAMKFSRQSQAFDTAKQAYEQMAQSIRDSGYEIDGFGEAIKTQFITLKDSIRNASTDSKASLRELADNLDNVINLLSGGGADNKLIMDLERMEQYLRRISKLGRDSGRVDSPINANEVAKANRQLILLNGKVNDLSQEVKQFENLSNQDKLRKSLGDSQREVEKLGNAYLKAHPVIKAFYNTLNSNKVSKSLITIGNSAKTYLGRAVEWFKKLRKEANQASSSVGKSAKGMQSSFKSLISSIAPILSIVGIFNVLKTSVADAMESIETNNMFDTVFGDSANQMDAWVQKMNQTLGLGVTDTKRYTSTIMQMGKAMGLTGDEALNMSQKMATMAGDISSFYNADIAQVQQDLQSAISGSYETMDKYGVVLRQSTVEQFAYANGIATVGSELTNAQRVMATTLYIEQALGVANGDLARSINSPANQARILRANLQDLSVALGNCFMPILTVVLPILNRFISALATVINAVADFISKLFSLFGVSVGGGGGGISSSSGVGGFLGDIADSAGNIGSSLEDGLNKASGTGGKIADAMEKGAQSAKEMRKHLLGVDQINNLSTDSSSGSGGSGGSGSGGSGGGSGSGSGGLGSGGLLGGIGNASEQIKQNGESVFGEIEGWIKDLANAMKLVWNTLKDGWNSVGGYITQSIANLKQAFSNLGISIKDFLIGAWNNGGEELVYNFGRLAGSITGMVIDVFAQCVQAVADLLQYLNPETNPYTRAFLNGLNNLLVACQNFALSVGGWFATFLNNGGQAFLNVMGDICMLLGSIFTQLLADCINLITSFMNSWLGYTVISGVAITLNVVAGAIKAVLIIIQKTLPLIEALGIAFATIALAKVANDFLNTWVAIKSGLVPLASMKTLGGQLANKIGLLQANVVVAKNAFVKFVKEGIQAFVKFSGQAFKALQNLVKSLFTLGKEALVSCVKGLQKFGSALFHPIKSFNAMKTAIVTNIQALGNWIKQMAVGAWNAIKNLISACATGIASMLGLATAEGTATAQSVLLGLALDALGIGLIIGAIVGLIAVIKNWSTISKKISELWQKFMDFLGEKCPWLKGIFEALGNVFSWIGEKLGWLWDKIKGFFGWSGENNPEEMAEDTDLAMEGLGDTAEQTSDRFGTSCSKINESLASIGIDSNKIATQLDEAEAMFNEKFNMISGNAREYLQAIADGNKDVLSQMSGDSDKYLAEIKSAFEDMSVQEQAVFYATYGEINGVTDGWLDYTTGSYEDCLIKHSAMLEQINNNEKLTYDEKKARIEEETQNFVNAQGEKLRQLNLTIAEMESAEWQSEEDKYNALRGYYEQRDQLIKDMENYQLGSIDTVDEAVKQSADTQSQAYDGVSTAQQDALKEVDSSLEETKGNLSSFKEESDKVASEIPKAWSGIGKTISDEFTKAKQDTIKCFNDMNKSIQNLSKVLKANLSNAFKDMSNNAKTSTTKMSKDVQNAFKSMCDSIRKQLNDLSNSMKNSFQSIGNTINKAFSDISSKVVSVLNNMKTQAISCLKSLETAFSSSMDKIKNVAETKMKSACDGMVNKVNESRVSIVNSFNSITTNINSSLDNLNRQVGSRMDRVLSTIRYYCRYMQDATNFTFKTPYMKMPHIQVYGNWDFEKKTVPSFRVSWWSSGAIFNKRTILGGVGVGDAQNGIGNNPELVTPIDKFYNELDKQFTKQNKALSKCNNQPILITLTLDGKTVTETVVNNFKDQSRRGVLDTSWL